MSRSGQAPAPPARATLRGLARFAGLVALTAFSLSGAPGARAEEGLDVGRWLDRPGVKVLAVEFYATWCKPCMAAVPKWKKLHERYRKEGLRLVVVATQDPEGGCANPGWNPDAVVCDEDGRVAKALGAGKALPAAFLWSWQGHLLVRRGHVEDVEGALTQWLREAPRVQVEVKDTSGGGDKGGIEGLVRAELQRTDKLVLVATAAERAALDKIKAEAARGRYDESMGCELGKELSANSLLEVRTTGKGDRPRLQLMLLSAERGCLVASAVVDWNVKQQRSSVAEAVSELLEKLRPSVEMPGSGDGAAQPKIAAVVEQPKAVPVVEAPPPKVELVPEPPPVKMAPPPVSAKLEWVSSRAAKVAFNRSEVTVGQFRTCVERGKCTRSNFDAYDTNKACNWGAEGRDSHPMNCINRAGASEFCGWIGGRLPKEAEWMAEATNGGTRKYPWGDQSATCDHAVMNTSDRGCGKGTTGPVCTRSQGSSAAGLCDLVGNVWEWSAPSAKADNSGSGGIGGVFDSFRDAVAGSTQKDPSALLGGSWLNGDDLVRSSAREVEGADFRGRGVGFRCVKGP